VKYQTARRHPQAEPDIQYDHQNAQWSGVASTSSATVAPHPGRRIWWRRQLGPTRLPVRADTCAPVISTSHHPQGTADTTSMEGAVVRLAKAGIREGYRCLGNDRLVVRLSSRHRSPPFALSRQPLILWARAQWSFASYNHGFYIFGAVASMHRYRRIQRRRA
jgi:hypothetical protein